MGGRDYVEAPTNDHRSGVRWHAAGERKVVCRSFANHLVQRRLLTIKRAEAVEGNLEEGGRYDRLGG